MSVGREHRATATSVSYYGLTTSTKSVDVLSRQKPRALEFAGVRMQSTTTDLAGWGLGLTSVCCQHSRRCCVDSFKQTLSNTGFEEQRVRILRRSVRILRAVRRHPARSYTRRSCRTLQQRQAKLNI